MTHRARARGAVGAVVDGRFRDLQEHRDVQFPVRKIVSQHQVSFRKSLTNIVSFIDLRSRYWHVSPL